MNIKKIAAAALLAFAVNGCGSASNDQGVSFTLLGFGQLDTDADTGASTCSDSVFTNVVAFPLSDATEGTGTVAGCLVLQNNQIKVAIRTERINLSYYIAGATEQPPATSIGGTVVIGPAQASTDTTTTDTSTTTTTGGISSIPSKVSLPTNLVPPSVREWMNLNRDKLPEPPFSMDIIASVSGVTTAGDQLTTNDGYLQSTVTQDVIVDPATSGTDDTATSGDTATDTGADTSGLTDSGATA